jgi:hypothetical protein
MKRKNERENERKNKKETKEKGMKTEERKNKGKEKGIKRKKIKEIVLVAVKSCKSKNQIKIMVVNHNYHLLANHNSIVFTTNLQLIFIILQLT